MASPVLLQSLGNGVLVDSLGEPITGHSVYVYARGTTTQVSVYSDSGLTVSLGQPLSTGSWIVPGSGQTAPAPGSVPGYVADGQEIDFYDATAGIRVPAEPVASGDVVADASGHGTADWAVVKEAPLNVKWAEYGAKGDGVTDDTAAVTAAINALPATGGEILFAGQFLCTSQLDLDGKHSVTLAGVGGISAGATPASEITFGQAGSTSALSCRSTYGITLRDLSIIATSASFTGDLIDFTHDGSGGQDSAYMNIENALLSAPAGCARLLDLDKAICGAYRNVLFSGASDGVGGVASASDYSNVHTFDACAFSGSQNIAVRSPGESWTLKGCTFEPLAGGAAGAIYSTIAAASGVTVVGCWFGDANTTSTWITLSGGGLTIIGNFIGTGNLGVQIAAASQGAVIVGNEFSTVATGIAVGNGGSNHLLAPNMFNGVTTPISFGSPIPSNSVYMSATGAWQFSGNVELVGQLRNMTAGNQATSATAGSATALPATPAGYLEFIDSTGTTRKLPYYAA